MGFLVPHSSTTMLTPVVGAVALTCTFAVGSRMIGQVRTCLGYGNKLVKTRSKLV